MRSFTRILTVAGVCILVLTLWYASASGFGLDNLTDPQSISDQRKDCPDYQRDKYGNCPPRSHRRVIGARAYYGGGGK